MADSNGSPLRSPLAVRMPLQGQPPPLLYDQWGRDLFGTAYNLPADPLTQQDPREIALVVHRDLPLISSMTGDWSLPLIKMALKDHMRGMFNLPSELADEISGDDRVQATIGSRTGGLFSQPLKHKGGSKACRKAWKAAWRKLIPQSVASEIMTWAVLLGFCVCEILWDTTATPWQPYLKVWHPKFIWYRIERREYWAITMDGMVPITPGTGKWLLFTPHGGYRGWVRGVIRSVAEKWFIKGLAWRDWARFNERHGLPIFKAKIPAAGDLIQKVNFISALSRLGQESVIGLPQNVDGTGYDAELLEARDRAWESFMGTIDRCDKSIVLPILWQNLTTEVKEGSLAAARVHGDVRQNAIEFDNMTLSEALYEQVARVFAYVNFGDAEEAPYSSWCVTPIEDYLAKGETFLKFGQGMQFLRQGGIQVQDVPAFAKLFGLDIGDVDDVDPTQVEAKAAGATAAPPGGTQGEQVAALWTNYRRMSRHLSRLSARVAA
jgi:phage gp29-like protein